MFEKEAYEYGKDKTDLATAIMNPQIETATRQGFKDGAEFGYNKANEWHYVEDGDLPKHNHEVLCLMWGGTKEIGYYENEVWHFEDFVADYEDVDYWQEIVPPKERNNAAAVI